MKAVKIIELITTEEMKYLSKEKGVSFGYEGISHTYCHHRTYTYYLCETRNNMRLLNEYRKSRIVEK